MAAAIPIPVPVPVSEGEAAAAPPGSVPGSLFENYDPVGALNGMFAPAYIHGFQPSNDAVANWMEQNHPLTNASVEDTRMPPEWRDPNEGTIAGAGQGFGPYGAGGIPKNLQFGDPRGPIDPAALQVLAQGGKYDMAGRRDAIAARLLSNTQAQDAYAKRMATDTPPAWTPSVDMTGYMKYEYQND
jgi:hypothetical protein